MAQLELFKCGAIVAWKPDDNARQFKLLQEAVWQLTDYLRNTYLKGLKRDMAKSYAVERRSRDSLSVYVTTTFQCAPYTGTASTVP